MSSETRIVRPYVNGQEFQRMLDDCALRCADQAVPGPADVAVSLDEYLNYPFAFLLSGLDRELASAGAAAIGCDLADIDLLVLAIAPRLRFVETVFRRDLGSFDELPDQIPLSVPSRPKALRAPHGGADIKIYFCLNRPLEPRPLAPWRRGTWLGQLEYRVRSGLSGNGFVPVRLTDDDRERLGIPRDAARFVTIDDNDPFDLDPPGEVVKLYVDGDLLDRLAVAASSPVGKHIQRQLFLDAAAAIVFAIQRRVAEEPSLAGQHIDDFAGSLVHRLTELLGGKGTDVMSRDSRQTEFRRLCDSPTAFMARLEAKTGMRRDMLASFGDIS